ncbi:MAG: hypothetical protein ACMVO3_12290 [Thalassobaculum sp.]
MNRLLALGVAGFLAVVAGPVAAGEDSELVIDGTTIVTKVKAPEGLAVQRVVFGLAFPNAGDPGAGGG